MYNISAARLGLSAVILFWASCAAEPSTTSSIALERGRSTLDPPVAPVDQAPAAVKRPAAAAIVPGAKQVGYYDMAAGSGQPYEVPPIVAAGGTAITIFDPSAAELANLNVFFVLNPDNFGFGFGYVIREPEIAAAVQNGMILVIHDREVADAASHLPGGAGFSILRDFTEGTDINIRDASTVVTAGLTNSSLDGGNFSSHGFANAVSLPARSKLILSGTTNDHIVTFCYPQGRGAVIYSTIPLDFYLQGFSGVPDFAAIYAPNVVSYALSGACAARGGPRPTPNVIN
jgi:hypothetical protein